MDARRRLVGERADAAARLAGGRAALDRLVDDAAGDNLDDEHDIEGASLSFEREQVRAILRQAGARLAEVDAALGRLDAGTYGVCESCGASIESGRLEARPTARTCVACAARPGR